MNIAWFAVLIVIAILAASEWLLRDEDNDEEGTDDL